MIQIESGEGSYQPPCIKLPKHASPQSLVTLSLVANAKSLYEANGVLVMENLLPKSVVHSLYDYFTHEYSSYLSEEKSHNALEVGDKRKMISVEVKGAFNDPTVYGHPLILKLMEGLLDTRYILGSMGVVCSFPGADDQHVHIDHYSLFQEQPQHVALPSYAVTLVVPLVDLTPESGSTRVWKGSHRYALNKQIPKEYSAVPYMETGSCYLMDYQLTHSGTPNGSNAVRPILYIIYYRPWFQEAVNYKYQRPLSISFSEYEKVPEPYRFLFAREISILELQKKAVDDYIQQQGKPAPAFERREEGQAALEDKPSLSFHLRSSSNQAQLLERAAHSALTLYHLDNYHLQYVSHDENTIFRVDAPHAKQLVTSMTGYDAHRYIFRVYRSNYLSGREIASELQWLRQLHDDLGLIVPYPVETQAGDPLVRLEGAVLDEPRLGVLLRSVLGEPFAGMPTQNNELQAIGRLVAQLHSYSDHNVLPESFVRPCWDAKGLFHTRTGFSADGEQVWALVPPEYRPILEEVVQRVSHQFERWDRSASHFGLIHGDLWSGNLIQQASGLGLLDLADSGFGYWGMELARFLIGYSKMNPRQVIKQYLPELLHGYREVRAFPQEQIDAMPLLMAAQHAVFSLWYINRSRDHSYYRQTLKKVLKFHAKEMISCLKIVGQ